MNKSTCPSDSSTSPRDYVFLERDALIDRIRMVKEGLPAQMLATLANDMHVSRKCLCDWLGIQSTTAARKAATKGALSQNESERTLGAARLLGQVQWIFAESGEPAGFDVGRWLGEWLEQPNPALGGHTPGEFMDTGDGRALISRLVSQMQSGAYA
jgi:putative toxin-antitoxin system antitoxin component (TIGR02293 family)